MLTRAKNISIQSIYQNTHWYCMLCQFCFALAPICLYSPLITLFFIAPITHHQLHSSFISPITSCITSYWIVYSFIIVIDKVVQCNYNCLPFQALNMDTNTKGTVSRKSYEIKDKRNFVLQVDELIATGLFSRLTACLNVGIPLLYYSCWKKLLELQKVGFGSQSDSILKFVS